MWIRSFNLSYIHNNKKSIPVMALDTDEKTFYTNITYLIAVT